MCIYIYIQYSFFSLQYNYNYTIYIKSMKPWHIIGSMSKESIACVPNICGRSVSTKFLYPDFAKAPRGICLIGRSALALVSASKTSSKCCLARLCIVCNIYSQPNSWTWVRAVTDIEYIGYSEQQAKNIQVLLLSWRRCVFTTGKELPGVVLVMC